MTTTVRFPLLFEINTRTWLYERSARAGRAIDLRGIEDAEIDGWQQRGFTHIWLMGVWPTGPRSRAEAVTNADLRRAYDDAVPGWTGDDIVGSPYAVACTTVAPLLGGDVALAHFRTRLHDRGMRLLLDFIPNHLGIDHAWVTERPELFVGSLAQFDGSFEIATPAGPRWLAHGKDPYFPGWTDTVQLDYRRVDTRAAMQDLLMEIADRCDGVRCDMAMLTLPDVFGQTWAHVPSAMDTPAEFWSGTIETIKARYPGFQFLAEAYWDLEPRLQDLGFDFTYDKTLYDRLVHRNPEGLVAHLLGLGEAGLARGAHFLENHDEPRIATLLAGPEHRAAALLTLGLPGLRLLHDGELEGAQRFARVQLRRRANEPHDGAITDIYEQVLAAIAGTLVGVGDALVLPVRQAWEDNHTHRGLVLVEWRLASSPDVFDLVVVNLWPHRAQGYVNLHLGPGDGGTWHLSDRLSDEHYRRDDHDLRDPGLYLDVPPHGAQLFAFTRHR